MSKLQLFAALLMPVLRPAAQEIGLSLAPMRVELAMHPGTERSGALMLSNDSAAQVRVRGELLDFFIDDTGTPQFRRDAAQEAAYSCRTWLSINPGETELAAGERKIVRYTLRMPKDASEGGFHCAAGFATLPSASQPGGPSLRMAVRVVAVFYATAGSPPILGSLKDLRLERLPASDGMKWEAVAVLENRGVVPFRPAGKLIVEDEQGEVVASVPFPPLPVLPRREQRFLFPLNSDLRPVRYKVKALVDIGGNDIQEAMVEVLPQPDH